MKTMEVILASLLCVAPAAASLAQAAQLAPPAPPAPPQALDEDVQRELEKEVYAVFPQHASSGNRTLVVPQEQADQKAVAEIEEDLNVMARILSKATGTGDKNRSAMGIALHGGFFGSSQPAPQNLYLEGYGALFFLNVNHPLQAPAAKPTENEQKDATSTEWEEAKRELYQSSGGGVNINIPGVLALASSPAEKYDADKVEGLKTELIDSLKNAAHIRRLKPNESVTLVVVGRKGGASETRNIVRRSGSGGRGQATATAFSTTRSGSTAGGEDRMIIRAKKSDIDALQKGKLDPNEFRKKVSVTVF